MRSYTKTSDKFDERNFKASSSKISVFDTKKFIDELEINHKISLYKLEKIIADETNLEYLFAAADRIRCKFSGRDTHLKALIEISNICKKECFYCGLRSANLTLKRYKMSPQQIIQIARDAVESGYHTIVLQSGESNAYHDDVLCDIIAQIHALGARITLSFGEKTPKQYLAYRNAGANRYLLRIETTSRMLYRKFHPFSSLQKRISCLKTLQNLGYETGSGLLVGLPGQNPQILARDLMFLKKNDFDMIGIGPFIPAQNTPLFDVPLNTIKALNLGLKITALARLLLPCANIPATTAMETLSPNFGRKKALQSGANVIMPAITSVEFAKFYALYPNKFHFQNSAHEIYTRLGYFLDEIKSNIAQSNGDSQRFIIRKMKK